MRRLLVFFLLAGLLGVSAFGQSAAQSGTDNSASVSYEVSDVGVDITADSAVHARDQAIVQAQRSAFEQLLGRLGADSAMSKKLDDDSLSEMVQNFEVQDQHTSAVRYIGTFTVQFKASAVREWLDKNGTTYSEAALPPLVILPVFAAKDHPVLWEEPTKWRAAWENANAGSAVPLVVPSGELDDVSVISTQEAVNGNAAALKALIEKYQAGGAAVVTLNGDPEVSGSELSVTIARYDSEGKGSAATHLSLPAAAGKSAADAALAQAVRQTKAELQGGQAQAAAKNAAQKLPVLVPINTLADWTAVKRKLTAVRAIDRVSTVTLERGAANIELEFRGEIDQLQAALAQQSLSLKQAGDNGAWILQMAAPEPQL